MHIHSEAYLYVLYFRTSIKANQGDPFQSPQIVKAKSTNHSGEEQRLSSPTLLGKCCGRMTLLSSFYSALFIPWSGITEDLSNWYGSYCLFQWLSVWLGHWGIMGIIMNTMVENLGFGDRRSIVWISVLPYTIAWPCRNHLTFLKLLIIKWEK